MCHNEVRNIFEFYNHYFKIKSLPLLKQRRKINALRLPYLLKYAIVSGNNENIKHWRKCAVGLFLFLKLVLLFFYQISIFSPNVSSWKTIKNVFLFRGKGPFRFKDIQIFVIFSTLSKFKRINGSGIIYDVMNLFA